MTGDEVVEAARAYLAGMIDEQIGDADAAGSDSRQSEIDGFIAEVEAAATTITALQARIAELEAGQVPGLPLVTAVAAERVRRGVMVQVHSSYRGKVYGPANYPAVTDLLVGLGVTAVRTKLAPAVSESVGYIGTLGRLGIRSYLTMGGYPVTDTQWTKMVAAVTQHTPHLLAITGYNEPNNGSRGGTDPPPADWAEQTYAHQVRIAALGRDLGVPVVGPALHDVVSTLEDDVVRLGALGLGEQMDRIGVHLYPRGSSPSFMLTERPAMYRTSWGEKPIDINEAGYFTDSTYVGGANPVTEAEQAAYLPRLVLEHASRGFRTGIFELLDDPTGGREGTLGMVACPSLDPATWRLKPAYHTVAALLAALAEPDAVPFTPAPLRLSVDGPEDVRSLLVGRSDGTYMLALWRDVDLPCGSETVTVRSPAGSRTVDVAGDAILLDVA